MEIAYQQVMSCSPRQQRVRPLLKFRLSDLILEPHDLGVSFPPEGSERIGFHCGGGLRPRVIGPENLGVSSDRSLN